MSQNSNNFSKDQFVLHQPADDTDPGFSVKGHKLRWVSNQVQARRAGRIWIPLKVSRIPAEVRKKLQDSLPMWFTGGDTIRKGDLTLAIAPMNLVEDRRKRNKESQKLNEGIFRRGAKHAPVGHGVTHMPDNDIRREVVQAPASAEFG